MGKAHSIPHSKLDEDEKDTLESPKGSARPKSLSVSTPSRVHAAAVSVRRITSPRARPHSVERDRFVDGTNDLPDIEMEELELYENIGWGATGKKQKQKQQNPTPFHFM